MQIPFSRPIVGLLIATSLSLFLGSCNKDKTEDIPTEDYDKLFPIKEIEKSPKPAGMYVIKDHDPDITFLTYKPLAPNDKSEEGHDTYDVTLTYLFKEPYQKGDATDSYYVLRFVDEQGDLVGISSDDNGFFLPKEEYDLISKFIVDGEDEENATEEEKKVLDSYHKNEDKEYKMPKDENKTVHFKLKSGQVLLLCAKGTALRGSSLVASIEAKSVSGLTPPIRLNVELYQNSEGMVTLPNPYCKYVILP